MRCVSGGTPGMLTVLCVAEMRVGVGVGVGNSDFQEEK